MQIHPMIDKMKKETTESEIERERRLFDEFKQKVLWAMLTNDYDTFDDLLDLDKAADPQKKIRIQRLLLQRQQFSLPGKEQHQHHRSLPHAYFNLLALLPPQDHRRPSRETSYEELLEKELKRYRGYLIHIATALERKNMFFRTMMGIYRQYGRRRAESLLLLRDGDGHTIAEVAFTGPSRRTLYYICVMLRDMANAAGWGTHGVKLSLRRAARHCTRSMFVARNMGKAVSWFLYFARRFYHWRDVSLFWAVYSGHFELLRYLVRDLGRGVVYSGLSVLHWAVMLYSMERVTMEKRLTLQYLIHNSDLSPRYPPVSPKDTSTVWFKGYRLFGGTAVHFALYPHTKAPFQTCKTDVDRPLGNSVQISSGHPEHAAHTDTAKTNSNTRLRSAPVTPASVFQMLEFLHKHGADFSLPDTSGKTPLDLLPPDADPQLVDTLIAFQKPYDQQGRCCLI